ncbi:MAG TPA: nucleotide pyrophosphohydrolase [Planctomycetes bacterium]|nr:nucleotide pyrophosphohydrolase [Planctomycetota bacterium]
MEGERGPSKDGSQEDYGIKAFQARIEAIYLERDSKRGLQGSTLWFLEEVGELIRALRRGERENLEEEFADVFAWLASLASIQGVDLASVVREKYGEGCPRCKETPCGCPR